MNINFSEKGTNDATGASDGPNECLPFQIPRTVIPKLNPKWHANFRNWEWSLRGVWTNFSAIFSEDWRQHDWIDIDFPITRRFVSSLFVIPFPSIRFRLGCTPLTTSLQTSVCSWRSWGITQVNLLFLILYKNWTLQTRTKGIIPGRVTKKRTDVSYNLLQQMSSYRVNYNSSNQVLIFYMLNGDWKIFGIFIVFTTLISIILYKRTIRTIKQTKNKLGT